MSEENNEVLKKIKKLMALATSSNEHEAKSATEKAQALLVRHNLTIQSLGQANHIYEEGSAGEKMSKVTREASFIMHILTQHFFVRCYFDTHSDGYHKGSFRSKYKRQTRIVGTQSNVEIAKYVYEYLYFTYNDLWKQYKKATGCSASAKNSYFAGLTEGIKETLKASEQKVCNEMGLTIVPDAGIKRYMDENLKLRSRGVSTIRRDASAEEAGREHGKNVKIARGLTGSSSNAGLALGYGGNK